MDDETIQRLLKAVFLDKNWKFYKWQTEVRIPNILIGDLRNLRMRTRIGGQVLSVLRDKWNNKRKAASKASKGARSKKRTTVERKTGITTMSCGNANVYVNSRMRNSVFGIP